MIDKIFETFVSDGIACFALNIFVYIWIKMFTYTTK